jgi:hypothetical protein
MDERKDKTKQRNGSTNHNRVSRNSPMNNVRYFVFHEKQGCFHSFVGFVFFFGCLLKEKVEVSGHNSC